MKKLALIATLGSVFLLGACEGESDASKMSVSFYKDSQTTCQYVIYVHAYGVAMEQRMNPDGTQMCDK